jgi:hypothetical protein
MNGTRNQGQCSKNTTKYLVSFAVHKNSQCTTTVADSRGFGRLPWALTSCIAQAVSYAYKLAEATDVRADVGEVGENHGGNLLEAGGVDPIGERSTISSACVLSSIG